MGARFRSDRHATRNLAVSLAVGARMLVDIPPARRTERVRTWRGWRWVALVGVWLACAAYVGPRLDRGWVPMDDGTLGQSAERVLQGDLPHRDFDDVYTGGLAQFDALVFRTMGTRLIALRYAMFAVFLLWVPTVFYIATRFAGPGVAAAVTFLCVVWSIATYPAAMPSAYNLFLATFGTAALIRFTETRRRAWLFGAGVAGGLSIIVKIVGLFYVAAALLFLAFDEQCTATPLPQRDVVRRDRAYAALVTTGALLFVLILVYLIRPISGAAAVFHFVVPGTALVAVLVRAAWRDASAEGSANRLRRMSRLLGPFVLGIAVPVVTFLYPYVTSGSVGALLHGVFVAPFRRFAFTVLPPLSLRTVVAALPWLLVVVPPAATVGTTVSERTRGGRIILGAYAAILTVLALATVHGGRPYVGVWWTVSYVAPVAVLAGCVLLTAQSERVCSPDVRREQLWLLLCMTALCSLIQVPYAGWGNIQYFGPIAILALLAIVTTRSSGAGPRSALVGGFFLAYGLAAFNPGHVTTLGTYLPTERWPRVPLAIPRTGVVSSSTLAETYERVVQLLDAHSTPGGYIYAGPDCPELYFLAQRRNPTRTLFDFLDDSAGRDARLLRTIDSTGVTVIAINTAPGFSMPIDSAFGAGVRTRFPDSAVVDYFVVRWRPGDQ